MIEDLVKVERIPLTRMEDRIETYESEKKVWQGVNRHISTFKDNARVLFGFENPFGERVATSEDGDVFTATANREALESEYKIQVHQTATADRFLSRPVDNDFQVPEGSYSFKIKDDEEKFSFRGGSLEKFAERINQKSKGKVAASVIKNSSSTQVMIIESQKEGRENQLILGSDFEKVGVELGLLKRNNTSQVDISFTPTLVSAPDKGEILSDKALKLAPGNQLEIPVKALANLDDMVLEMDVYTLSLAESTYTPPEPPSVPELKLGSAGFGGVEIQNQGFDLPLPEWQPPPRPEKITDMNLISGIQGRSETPFPPLENREGLQKISLKLKDYLNGLDALKLQNNNTHKEVTFENIRIYNPNARGDYSPANPIASAQDAILNLNGVEVLRSSNNIDDLIAGVTLNLKKPSEDELSLKVEPDRELIKEKVINFIGSYNRLLAELQILTKNDPAVVEELTYLSDEELETSRENLGMFQGEISLNQMKSRLQRVLMSPYETEAGQEISLLAHVGISTNATGQAGSINAGKLRGYLEMDMEKFDQALEKDLGSVKELFGKDTDGDLVMDSGAAYGADTYLRPFTQIGGIIPLKLSSIDRQIANTNDDIDDYKLHLEDYEAKLKRQYGMMEGTLGSMEQSFTAIENFNNNNASQ